MSAPTIAQVSNVAEWERLHAKQRALAEVEALARGGRLSAEQAIDDILGRIRDALPEPAAPLPATDPSDPSDRSDRSDPPTPEPKPRKRPGKRQMIPARELVDAATAVLENAAEPMALSEIAEAMLDAGFDPRGARPVQLRMRIYDALKRGPNQLRSLGKRKGWVLERTAVCARCRADFLHRGVGPLPTDALCGRPACAPVDASHRGPAPH